MNRIVREHYPVSNLPQDLREGLEGLDEVKVTVESIGEAQQLKTDLRPLAYYRKFAKPHFETFEQIEEHVRALRDEWDHR